MHCHSLQAFNVEVDHCLFRTKTLQKHHTREDIWIFQQKGRLIKRFLKVHNALVLQSMQNTNNSHKTLNSLIGKWLKQVGSNKKTFRCMRPSLSTKSIQYTLAKLLFFWNPPYMTAGSHHNKLVSMARSSEKTNCTYDVSQYQPAGHGNHLSHTHHRAIACRTQMPTKLGTALSLHTTQNSHTNSRAATALW